MKHRIYALLVSSSILAIASSMSAHAADPATPQQQVAQTQTADIGEEIIVTARRKAENLQIVPETVEVVTAQEISKFNITSFTDIATLIPGITLSKEPGSGFAEFAEMRGVDYSETSSTPATVTTYLNDVPVDVGFVFQNPFDTGQIEVLKGPTGTLRGEISPSGSITVTTKAPDLEKMGGYLEVTAGSLKNTNIQGAFNVPIVEDKLAIRIAGVRQYDTLDGVHSIFNHSQPYEDNQGGRVSVRFAPNDDINAVFTYQDQLDRSLYFGGAVTGTGSPGGCVTPPAGTYAADACPAANFNGPAIGPNALETASSFPDLTTTKQNFVDGKIDWTFHGQKLSYVGSWAQTKMHTDSCTDATGLPGECDYDGGNLRTFGNYWTQELRLSSVNPLWDRLDYTVGFFYKNVHGEVDDNLVSAVAEPGYYGSPAGAPQLGNVALQYAIFTNLLLKPDGNTEYAGYGSLTFHIDKKTEITGGVRGSSYSQVYTNNLQLVGLNGGPDVLVHLPGVPCALAHLQTSPYANYCQTNILAAISGARPPALGNGSFHPVVYNVELSHRFNDDLMVYARTASSFVPGNIQVGPALSGSADPSIQPFLFPNPETSKDYEGGIKSEWFDKRLLFDIDYYHQIYKNYFYNVPPFYYELTSIVPGTIPAVTSEGLIVANEPAVVNGIEITSTAKVTPTWTISPNFSWSDGHLSNGNVPCSPTAPGVVPTLATFTALGKLINFCKSNAPTSAAPRWNASIQSEYFHHINDSMDGFIRGLLNYYPSNPYANMSTPYTVPSYAILNLYVGVRKPDSAWEVDAYGKNITGTNTITELGQTAPPGQYFGSSGYVSIGHVSRREFGITAHYAFGSR